MVVTSAGVYQHPTGLNAYEIVVTDDAGEQVFVGVLYRGVGLPDSFSLTYGEQTFQVNLS